MYSRTSRKRSLFVWNVTKRLPFYGTFVRVRFVVRFVLVLLVQPVDVASSVSNAAVAAVVVVAISTRSLDAEGGAPVQDAHQRADNQVGVVEGRIEAADVQLTAMIVELVQQLLLEEHSLLGTFFRSCTAHDTARV